MRDVSRVGVSRSEYRSSLEFPVAAVCDRRIPLPSWARRKKVSAVIDRRYSAGGQLHLHSVRNASIGFTFVARLAGRRQATNATAPRRRVIVPSVSGSWALVLKSIDPMAREAA